MKNFFLKIIAFFAGLLASSKKDPKTNPLSNYVTDYTPNNERRRSISYTTGRMPFYFRLRYKRGKKGKVMAFS